MLWQFPLSHSSGEKQMEPSFFPGTAVAVGIGVALGVADCVGEGVAVGVVDGIGEGV